MSGPIAGAMQTQVLAPTYRPLTVHGSITHSLPARALINLTFGAAIFYSTDEFIESTSAAIDARLCGLQLCELSMGTNRRCVASRWSKPKVGQQRLWALLGLLLWFNFILSYRNLAIIFLRQELRLGSICKYSPGSVGETAGPRDVDFLQRNTIFGPFWATEIVQLFCKLSKPRHIGSLTLKKCMTPPDDSSPVPC